MNRVAIVGYGFMGKTHFGAWKKAKGAKVVAVCDSNLAQLTAKTVGNIKGAADNSTLPKSVRVYSDFTEMLKADGFDIVDITLPTPLHPDMTVAALEAGYHVICEKPMALDVKKCDRMIAAAKKAKRKLFVGQSVRFNPLYIFLKEAVADGRFGKVVAADFTRFCPAPGWNNGGKCWFLDESKSGGAAIDMHVHDADFIQYLFGLPSQVTSNAHVRADGLTDHLTTFYRYPGMLVTSDTSWAAGQTLVFDAAYRVFFEKATVYCGEAYQKPLVVYPMNGKPFEPKLQKGTGYEREIRYFNDCFSGREPEVTVVTAEDARNAIALVCAEKRSARLGRPVAVAK